jgi:hypothetical protein
VSVDLFAVNQTVANQFTCATEYELGLGRNGMESQRIMSYFSWFYVFVIVLLLVGTAIVQIKAPIQDDEYRAVPLVGKFSLAPSFRSCCLLVRNGTDK